MIDQLLIALFAGAYFLGAVSGWIVRDLEKSWTADDERNDWGSSA